MIKPNKPSVRERRMLDHLREAAEQASAAHSRLVEAVRAGHRAGLRPTWIAAATGLHRSTVHRMLKRGDRQGEEG
jgi:DNA-binding transcriptional regulator LsrR (DeoR family)